MYQENVDGKWKEIVSGESVGHRRLESFEFVATAKLRLIVTAVGSGSIIMKTGGKELFYIPDDIGKKHNRASIYSNLVKKISED